MELYILNCKFGDDIRIVGIYTLLSSAQAAANYIYGPLTWYSPNHGSRNPNLQLSKSFDAVIDTITADQELHSLDTWRAAVLHADET